MSEQEAYIQEQLGLAAKMRSELHDKAGRKGVTFIKDPTVREQDSLRAEWEFAKVCGLMPDLRENVSGDGGADFTVDVRYTVDVKASRNPGNLLIPVGKVTADIYVLYDTDESWPMPCPIGWMWGARMKKQPSKDFGYGVESHYMPAKQLMPFPSLIKMLRRHKNLGGQE